MKHMRASLLAQAINHRLQRNILFLNEFLFPGLAVKNFIDTGAGVVDYDYRGNVGVVLFNHGEADFEIKRGDRIAQVIL